MNTFTKFSAVVATLVVAAHGLVAGGSALAVQAQAEAAMHPLQIVKAEPIVIQAKRMAVVKAERITILATPTAHTSAHGQLALNSLGTSPVLARSV